YEQTHFTEEDKRGQLRLVGSQDGRDGSVTIHQNVNLYASLLEAGDRVTHTLAPDRAAWLQVVRGVVTLNGHSLTAGDGAAIAQEPQITLETDDTAELLLFDMAA
ncbi:MAG: pirin family protein, partial [Cyanobacteria bacterium P01_A01_bin.135]